MNCFRLSIHLDECENDSVIAPTLVSPLYLCKRSKMVLIR